MNNQYFVIFKCREKMRIKTYEFKTRRDALDYYNIGDRGTRSFKQLTELFAGNGMIGFVAKERVDGKLILPEAVQILKITGSSKG